MKNEGGQLYTIEGFAAALIMLMTAYLVVNATSVYTAGDTHISDMQLEALGSDALTMMGTNESRLTMSPLESTVEFVIDNPNSGPNATFRTMFLSLVNNGTGVSMDANAFNESTTTMKYIQFTANYTCWDTNTNTANPNNPISYSRNLTGGEHTVRATKWVIIDKGAVPFCGTTNKPRAVLVEVLLWRD
jgi:pyocin large subunit-like protein